MAQKDPHPYLGNQNPAVRVGVDGASWRITPPPCGRCPKPMTCWHPSLCWSEGFPMPDDPRSSSAPLPTHLAASMFSLGLTMPSGI